MFWDTQRPYSIHLRLSNLHQVRRDLLYPYDPVLMYALVLTLYDVLQTFGARVGYVSLYKLIVVFDFSVLHHTPAQLMTMYASFATVRFNYHWVNNLCTKEYVNVYTTTKLQSIFDKQCMFVADYYQTLPEHVDSVRNHVLYLMQADTHLMLQEYASILYPNTEVSKYSSAILTDWVRALVQLPDFVVYGMLVKRDVLGHLVARSVASHLEQDVFRALGEPSWNALEPLGSVVDISVLYSVKIMSKMTSTSAAEPGSAAASDLGTQNSTGLEGVPSSSVSSSDHCSK